MEKHSVAAHPRDSCLFEAPIIAERIEYYIVNLRWLETQGELPSRPTQRGLQIRRRVSRVSKRIAQRMYAFGA